MSDKAPEPEARRLLPRGLAHPALGMLGVITLVLVGWALHVMQPVFLPIVFAFFLALLLSPVDARGTSGAGGPGGGGPPRAPPTGGGSSSPTARRASRGCWPA